MRTRFTQAPGVSFRAIGLSTGIMRGLEIDNPSGSWLYIPSLETFVKPYIVGWSYSFPYDVAAIDIVAGNGPAGQPGTAEGDPVVVYLTDEQVATSEGSPSLGDTFRPITTPVQNTFDTTTALQNPVGNTITLITAADALGKMVRVYSFRLWYDISLSVVGGVNRNLDTPVLWRLRATPVTGGLDDFLAGMITREHPVDLVELATQPRDLPGTPGQGIGVKLTVRATWASTLIGYHLRWAFV